MSGFRESAYSVSLVHEGKVIITGDDGADIARQVAALRTRAEAAESELDAMRGVVEAAWRVDACEDPEAEETAHAFDDLRKRLVDLDALTKTEG